MGLHVKGTVAHGAVAGTQSDRDRYEGGWAKPTSPDTMGGPLTSRDDHANGLHARGQGQSFTASQERRPRREGPGHGGEG